MNALVVGFFDAPERRPALAGVAAHAAALLRPGESTTCLALSAIAEEEESAPSVECDRLVLLEAPGWDPALPRTGVGAVFDYWRENRADIVLFGNDEASRELAGRFAAKLECACFLGVNSLSRDGDDVIIEKPAYSSNLTARLRVAATPIVVAVETDGAPALAPGPGFSPPRRCASERRRADAAAPECWIEEQSVEPDPQGNPLPGAAVVVVGGKGVGGAEGFGVLERLAKRLGGEVGATRPAALDGWLDAGRLIGQSGLTVRPKLALLFGVSGAAPFLAGLRAGTVVAINRDPDAPVFAAADFGTVADWREFADALMRARIADGSGPGAT